MPACTGGDLFTGKFPSLSTGVARMDPYVKVQTLRRGQGTGKQTQQRYLPSVVQKDFAPRHGLSDGR